MSNSCVPDFGLEATRNFEERIKKTEDYSNREEGIVEVKYPDGDMKNQTNGYGTFTMNLQIRETLTLWSFSSLSVCKKKPFEVVCGLKPGGCL